MKIFKLLSILLFIGSFNSLSQSYPTCSQGSLSYHYHTRYDKAIYSVLATDTNNAIFNWKVNGVLLGTGKKFTYTFPTSGTITVCLEVQNSYFNSTTSTWDTCQLSYCEVLDRCFTARIDKPQDTVCIKNMNKTVYLGRLMYPYSYSNPVTYNWTYDPSKVSLNNSSIYNPHATLTSPSATIYLTMSDSMGCTSKDSIFIDTTCLRFNFYDSTHCSDKKISYTYSTTGTKTTYSPKYNRNGEVWHGIFWWVDNEPFYSVYGTDLSLTLSPGPHRVCAEASIEGYDSIAGIFDTCTIYFCDTISGHTSTSINKQNDLLELSIFPNPVNDVLTIKFEQVTQGNSSIRILDVSGKLIRNEILASGETTINVATISPGTYIMMVVNSENQYYKPIRFIKN